MTDLDTSQEVETIVIPKDAYKRLKRQYIVLNGFVEWLTKSAASHTGESIAKAAVKTLEIVNKDE